MRAPPPVVDPRGAKIASPFNRLTPRLKLLEVEVDGYTYVLNRIRPLPADTLTNRQRQVVRLVTQGLSNREIARKLRRSPATVAAHLRRIFQTLGVKSRTALVKHALTY